MALVRGFAVLMIMVTGCGAEEPQEQADGAGVPGLPTWEGSEVLADRQSTAMAPAVNGTSVFWLLGKFEVRGMPKQGGVVETLAMMPLADTFAQSLAADEEHVYVWSRSMTPTRTSCRRKEVSASSARMGAARVAS